MPSTKEKIDMVLIYGESGYCIRKAVRLYSERFPSRICPSRSSYTRVINRFKETGGLENKKRKRVKLVTNENNEINILAAVALDPHVSTRQLQQASGISRSSIGRILRRNNMNALHVSRHQDLDRIDFENRVRFCEWGLQQLQEDNAFFNKVLFTDEVSFSSHGQVSLRNVHYWSVENPRWLKEVENQEPWSINVWCGIVDNQIIGPYFVDGPFNKTKYARFLTKILSNLLLDVSLDVRQNLWYQHDDCPVHYARKVTDILCRKFGNRWIGRMGHQKWPLRSPDLTPLGFFLWGKLKEEVYREAPTTREGMQERIQKACIGISEQMLKSATQSMGERLRCCLSVAGEHFEHLM